MKNIYIYCEGPTEESFVNEIIYPYLLSMDIFVYPIICTTKRTNSHKYKGGVSSYSKIKKELIMLARSHPNEYVTTMFDYYAMPEDTPNIDCAIEDLYSRIESIEAAVTKDLNTSNCKFNFMVHEFEGLLFSNPQSFELIADDHVVGQIQSIKSQFPSPEHINNSPETAPSKRIIALIPQYAKIKNGVILSKAMGIDKILEECPHFKEWIDYMIALPE